MNLARLNPRERVLVILGALIVVGTLCYLGLVEPYRHGLQRLDRLIDTRRTQLTDMRRLQQEYQQLQARLAAGRQQAAQQHDFALLSFLEATAGRLAGREKLVAMRPQVPAVQNGYREERVEIKLEKLRLAELVRLLHALETAAAPLHVTTLRVTTRFDDRNRLDVSALISYTRRES
jgi:general secretion pathway protein M